MAPIRNITQVTIDNLHELIPEYIHNNKTIIQIYDAKVQHSHGEIKVKSALRRNFIRNYNFTYDELYYFFKINKHKEIYSKLKKKLPNYFFKIIFNFLLLKFNQSTYYFSKTAAFYKFKKFINNNKNI